MLHAGETDMALELENLQAMWLDLRAHVDRLAGERQHYADFFEQASEAYVVTEVDGTIRDANGPATDILQRRRRYVRGKPFVVMVALEQRSEFRRRLQSLATREPGAARSWRTVLEAPELRTEVTLTARLIERADSVGGICWRIQAVR
jgi:PAS domain S-box-containing protein